MKDTDLLHKDLLAFLCAILHSDKLSVPFFLQNKLSFPNVDLVCSESLPTHFDLALQILISLFFFSNTMINSLKEDSTICDSTICIIFFEGRFVIVS